MFLESPRSVLSAADLAVASPMRRLEALDRRLKRAGWFYPVLIALGCCFAWAGATQVVRAIGFGGFYGVPFALGAVVIAAWLAGVWSGLLTAGISVLLLHAILPSVRVLDVQEESIWHLTVFTLVAVIMSGFQASLREQRNRERREKEMRDEFLAIVSHELRTPVTVISGSANLLSRLWETITPDDRESLLVGLQDESLRMTWMIDDLLLLARIESGPADVNEPVLLQPAVQKAIQAFRRLYAGRRVVLEAQDDRLVIEARDVYVDAVLRNVFSNAHRFSPEDTPIEVRVFREDRRAVVLVRDHGPGVSDELLDEIYRPYFRSQPLSDGTRGLGLGLVLCKRAMEAMGGSITARPAEGGGLEVRLSFRTNGLVEEPSVPA